MRSGFTNGCVVAVVEDDVALRTAIRSLLRSRGLTVAAFAAAEDFLSSGLIDEAGCLIADLRLPGMSGLELQRLVASDRRLPTVFISAHDDPAARERVGQGGALAFLRKPFAGSSLLEVVCSVVTVPEDGARHDLPGRVYP
jgi:FixJ family two-component response regulator